MVPYCKTIALAATLSLLVGFVPAYAVGIQLDAPLLLSAASLDTVGIHAVTPAHHKVPLAVRNGQPADEVLDTFDLELAQIQLQFNLNHSAVQSPDRGFCSLENPFDLSLVSQHVRLQI
ncbi:hypothetical protein [Bythopirellula polymerisocia]|uniref:Uncharacterized protein n=1 Tax=Bythopirellula polymerisocia TaxID=2528003 RepID=A0A5C6D3B6_9BACT|nr:hypothetical protein [Bythopirellula polymerisocia]TWU30271.1 hypothetical protein Pla144_10570 [Bythopirellula polymerisocia]